MTIKQITLRYFDGCPNWKTADVTIRQALRATGLADGVTVTYQRVETPEDAKRLGFIGSPTGLIDGIDPWNERSGPTGLSCRIYQTENGPQGSPSLRQLTEILASASP
jgi:hypothetical protein